MNSGASGSMCWTCLHVNSGAPQQQFFTFWHKLFTLTPQVRRWFDFGGQQTKDKVTLIVERNRAALEFVFLRWQNPTLWSCSAWTIRVYNGIIMLLQKQHAHFYQLLHISMKAFRCVWTGCIAMRLSASSVIINQFVKQSEWNQLKVFLFESE